MVEVLLTPDEWAAVKEVREVLALAAPGDHDHVADGGARRRQ
jgi:hypothetical protein